MCIRSVRKYLHVFAWSQVCSDMIPFHSFLLVPKEGLTTAKDEKEEKAAETGGLASIQGYVDLGIEWK